MNLEPLFNALASVWAVGEIFLIVFTETRQGDGKVQDRGSQIILLGVIFVSLNADSSLHRFFPIDMPGSANYLWFPTTAGRVS